MLEKKAEIKRIISFLTSHIKSNFNLCFWQEPIPREHQKRKTGKQQITVRLSALSALTINLTAEAGKE